MISRCDYGIIVSLFYPRKEFMMEDSKVQDCVRDAVRIVCAAIRRRKAQCASPGAGR